MYPKQYIQMFQYTLYNGTKDATISSSDLKAAIDDLHFKLGKYNGAAINDLIDMQENFDKLMEKNQTLYVRYFGYK